MTGNDGKLGFSMSMSRRRFLTSAAAMAGAATVARYTPAHAATEPVVIQTFETYHEDPWIEAFTNETGIPVEVIRVGSVDEMFSLPQSGATAPDLVFIDSGTLTRFVDADLLAPIDVAKVQNAGNISPSLKWQEFNSYKGELWGVPYSWGTIPLMYDADQIPEQPTSWKSLWNTDYAGYVSTFDDAYLNIPMVALSVGAKDPYALTDEEMGLVREALRELRAQVRVIARGFDDMASLFMAGDAKIAYCQNIAVVNKLQDNGRNVQLSYPDEGTPFWVDNALLMKRGADRPEVYALIDAGLGFGWQARFTDFSGNNCVVDPQKALEAGLSQRGYDRSELKYLGDDAFMARMSILRVPSDMDERLQLWDEFKAGLL